MNVSMPALVSRYVKLERRGSVWQGLCPFHKDKSTPSFTVYPKDAYCFGCREYFSPKKFLMEYLRIGSREAKRMLGEVVEELPQFKSQRKLDEVPLDVIKTWFSMLKSHRQYFKGRLFTNKTIDREMFGWTGSRYSIPVWEKPGGRCLAARLRASDPNEKVKYIGYAGCNGPQLYNRWFVEDFYKDWPEDILKTIYIFYGEMDCALASQDGFPSVSPTNGQNVWLDEWDSFFNPYNIVIIPDRKEYLRGFQVASRFPGRSTVVHWPEGEFSDYNSFRLQGGTPENFLCDIIDNACQPEFSIEHFWEAEYANT